MENIGQQGYAIIPSVFNSEELAGLEITRIGGQTRAGARHVLGHPTLGALARAPRVIELASEILGGRAIPFRATFFDKHLSRNWLVYWHQDTAVPIRERRDVPGFEAWSMKAGITYAHAPSQVLRRIIALRIHFDASTSTNGALRVLPGTHERGLLTDEEVRVLGRSIPCVPCLVDRGGIVAMRPLLIHASSKCETSTPRRVLHVELTTSLQLPGGLELAFA